MLARLGGYLKRGVLHRRAAARSLAGVFLALLVLATLPAAAEEDVTEQDLTEQDVTEKGAAILTAHCARCHAIGTTGDSPKEEAPPFRVLSENYPVEDLAESLAEGIMSGHPDMPVFVFEPHDVDAIIVYLKSIQISPAPAPVDGDG